VFEDLSNIYKTTFYLMNQQMDAAEHQWWGTYKKRAYIARVQGKKKYFYCTAAPSITFYQRTFPQLSSTLDLVAAGGATIDHTCFFLHHTSGASAQKNLLKLKYFLFSSRGNKRLHLSCPQVTYSLTSVRVRQLTMTEPWTMDTKRK
jgi:hypothetical protein